MPYKLKKKGGKYCVVKKDSGETVKCHDSRQKAIKHLQALNINVESSVDAALDVTWDAVMELAKAEARAAGSHAGSPVLVTVPNIPIMEAGVEYKLSTGPTTFTPEDLADIVTAAGEDPSIPTPRIKIGHVDPRYNDTTKFDGSPSFGKAINLRLSENGMVIYADFVGVPKWLADIMPTAYANRSVEVFWGVESQAGKTWRAVCTAVALLGVNWPGVMQLEDLPQYYGEEMPSDVEVVAASQGEEGDAVKLLTQKKKPESEAAANLDDIRRAFYQSYIEEHKSEGAMWWWIRAVMTDPNQLVIEDDEDGQLYILPFSSDAKGVVTFGEPDAVRIDYVPDARKKDAAAHAAALLTVGHEVAASWDSRDDSVPANPTQGGAMDRAEAIKRLNLPEDASDEQIYAALAEVVGAVAPEAQATTEQQPAATPPIPGAPQAQEPAQPEPLTPPAPVVTAPDPAPAVAGAAVLSEPRPEPTARPESPFVQLDRDAYNRLVANADLGVKAYERLETVEHDKFLDQAMAMGKFPPSRREAWASYMAQDPDGAKAAIDNLQAGLVPVNGEEIGRNASASEGEGPMDILLPFFPEIQKRRSRDAAVEAGLALRGRIQTDGSLRRGGVLNAR